MMLLEKRNLLQNGLFWYGSAPAQHSDAMTSLLVPFADLWLAGSK